MNTIPEGVAAEGSTADGTARAPGAPGKRQAMIEAVLSALGGGPLHGYGVAQLLASRDVHRGHFKAVYRHLYDLEQSELVSSRWETAGPGPARRVYSLTDAGQGGRQARTPDLTAHSHGAASKEVAGSKGRVP